MFTATREKLGAYAIISSVTCKLCWHQT